MSLTKKQKEVLDFIISFYKKEVRPPTYKEIQLYFGLKSKSSVQDYVRYLRTKGFLKETESGVIELTKEDENFSKIPLLGLVAAGRPIEVFSDQGQELIEVPSSMCSRGNFYALKVKGESMIDDGILDGDIVVVQSKQEAKNGETVVALVDGSATLKKYYYRNKKVELHPRNKTMTPIIVDQGELSIQGILVGLLRDYLN